MFKKIWILLAIAYTTVLTVVSLMTLRNLPDVGVSYGDKIFHFFAYFVMAFLWALAWFFSFNFDKKRSIRNAFIIAVIFGIIIEVLQGTLTASRSLDVYDMLANTLGALLAAVVLSVNNFKQAKKL